MNAGDWSEIGRHLIHEWADRGQCQRQKQTGNKSGHGINVTNKPQTGGKQSHLDPWDLKLYF